MILVGMIHVNLILKVNGMTEKKIFSNIFFSALLVFIEVPLIVSMVTFSTYQRDAVVYRALLIILCIFFGIFVVVFSIGGSILIKKYAFSKFSDNKKSKKYVRFSTLIVSLGGYFFFLFFFFFFVFQMLKNIVVFFIINYLLIIAAFIMISLFQHSTSLSGSTNRTPKSNEKKSETSGSGSGKFINLK